MTEPEAALYVRRIYWLVLGFGLLGVVVYLDLQGWRPAAGFALGALASLGNLWLYERLRYVVMIAIAYAIVKALGVNALAVILGLLTSTAAVVTSTVVELLESFFARRSSH
jgi:hypothetical protein